MDWGVTSGTATVVAFSDGHASVYLSSGGGFIGGAESHESVRNAAKKLVLAASEYNKSEFRRITSYPLPKRGVVSFYLLTDEGVFSENASEIDLSNGRHPLSKLGNAAQDVVTQYRLVQ